MIKLPSTKMSNEKVKSFSIIKDVQHYLSNSAVKFKQNPYNTSPQHLPAFQAS